MFTYLSATFLFQVWLKDLLNLGSFTNDECMTQVILKFIYTWSRD